MTPLRKQGTGALLLLLVVCLLLGGWFWKRPISGRGGLPIPGELVIEIPQFFQGDPRWRDDLLADTPGTLAAQG